MKFFSLFNTTPSSLRPICVTKPPRLLVHRFLFHTDFNGRIHHSSSSFSINSLEERDSQQFEVDPEKARDALRNLDQQLQSLSQKKPVSPPKKIKAPDLKFERSEMTEAMPEFSESFLAYTVVALVLFTIFYNVFFYLVIKPSVDGPEEELAQTTTVFENRKATVLQSLPLIPEVLFQR